MCDVYQRPQHNPEDRANENIRFYIHVIKFNRRLANLVKHDIKRDCVGLQTFTLTLVLEN